MTTNDYALTFHGDTECGYHGVYALPGDPHWRHVRRADGTLLRRKTAKEAEADAGHRLVAELNRTQATAPKLLAALEKLMPYVTKHRDELIERWRENSHLKMPDEALDLVLEETIDAYREAISAAAAAIAEAEAAGIRAATW
jgi:hypothetical protein